MIIKFHYKDGANPDLKGVRAFDLKKHIVEWNNDSNTVGFWSFNSHGVRTGWFVYLEYVDSIELEHDQELVIDDEELMF